MRVPSDPSCAQSGPEPSLSNRLEALRGEWRGFHSIRIMTKGGSYFAGTEATRLTSEWWTIIKLEDGEALDSTQERLLINGIGIDYHSLEIHQEKGSQSRSDR
jgi:hypothetical protein